MLPEPHTPTVTRLARGTPLPEWLCVIEPRRDIPPGHAQRGDPKFGVDVDILDLPDYYVVMPTLGDTFEVLIDLRGTLGCVMLAATKTVLLVSSVVSVELPENWRPDNTRPVHEVPGLGAPAHPAPPAMPFYPKPVYPQPDPHPTFWARLRYAFTGR